MTTPATTPRTKDEAAQLETAARRLPGGVLGSTRFADDMAFVVKRARGSRIWDVSGREYVDYLLGSGPMFLGHAHPAVTRAVTAYQPASATSIGKNGTGSPSGTHSSPDAPASPWPGGAYEITIRDRGPGIPHRFRKHLFERFAQAEPQESSKTLSEMTLSVESCAT